MRIVVLSLALLVAGCGVLPGGLRGYEPGDYQVQNIRFVPGEDIETQHFSDAPGTPEVVEEFASLATPLMKQRFANYPGVRPVDMVIEVDYLNYMPNYTRAMFFDGQEQLNTVIRIVDANTKELLQRIVLGVENKNQRRLMDHAQGTAMEPDIARERLRVVDAYVESLVTMLYPRQY